MLVFVLLVCMGDMVCVVGVADLMLCVVWFTVMVLVRYANCYASTKISKDLCDVLISQWVDVIAVVLMASCIMGCDRRCCSVMLRNRVEGNPICAEKLLSSSSLLSRASCMAVKYATHIHNCLQER